MEEVDSLEVVQVGDEVDAVVRHFGSRDVAEYRDVSCSAVICEVFSFLFGEGGERERPWEKGPSVEKSIRKGLFDFSLFNVATDIKRSFFKERSKVKNNSGTFGGSSSLQMHFLTEFTKLLFLTVIFQK